MPDDETQEVTVEVDAEFITELGDELRHRDESLTELVDESCRRRLRDAD